ncbi:MAG: MlaD family protein [Thermodesulfobacteriota bacterium]|nr:MlaD family protein [Thermodesulfobacteriota bacterium]
MPRKTSNFMIGLFVTAGILIGAGAIVWVSASKYFSDGAHYVSYFNESVQGLKMNSAVRYRGVDVGIVEDIRVAPDNKLVEVVMKIDLKGDLEHDVVSQLKAIGITGLVVVEMDRRKPSDSFIDRGFPTGYPVISSRPSEIKAFLSGIDNVIEKIKLIDFVSISDKLQFTVSAAGKLLADKRIDRIITTLESTTSNLESISSKLENLCAENGVLDLLKETRMTFVEARQAIAEIRSDLDSMNLAETAGKADNLIEDMRKQARLTAIEIHDTSENLRRASETLEKLLERLSMRPSDLINSRPLPPREIE